MQCTNCQFQNMPGTHVCGRCGTSLGLATAVIDVHPPRAKPLAKRLRRHLPVRRRLYQARDVLVDTGTAAAARKIRASLPPGALFFRMAFPGWSHFYAGHRVRGQLFLWSFCACLLPGLLLWGTGWGSIFLGLAFSVHSSAALDVINLTFVQCGFREIMIRSLAVTVVLAAAVYWPAGRLLTSFADPQVMAMRTTGFDAGEVLLVNHWAKPSPGRVVLYDMPEYTVRTTNPNGHGVINTRYQGARIERILAGPGDEVRIDNGIIFVNGRPPLWLPLGMGRLPTRLAQSVPSDCYFILPSTTQLLPPPDQTTTWQEISTVPKDSVRGVAYVRSQPLSRFQVIR